MSKNGVVIKVSPDYVRIMRELNATKGSFVTVGIQGEEAQIERTNDEGKTLNLSTIATINEFGSSDGRVPARSFLRSTFDERRDELRNVQRSALAKVMAGQLTAEQGLGLIGLWLSSAVKKKITDLKTPPNAPRTIARKGSSNPLIDTGQMRASITHVVHMSGGADKTQGLNVVRDDGATP